MNSLTLAMTRRMGVFKARWSAKSSNIRSIYIYMSNSQLTYPCVSPIALFWPPSPEKNLGETSQVRRDSGKVDEPHLEVVLSRPQGSASSAEDTQIPTKSIKSAKSVGAKFDRKIMNHWYPLVNIQKTMEIHHFSWVNQLIINGPCSIAIAINSYFEATRG